MFSVLVTLYVCMCAGARMQKIDRQKFLILLELTEKQKIHNGVQPIKT